MLYFLNTGILNGDDANIMTRTEKVDAPLGVVLVTHSDYGEYLLKAAEMIVGRQEGCTSVSVDGTSEVDATVTRLREAATSCDAGAGVVLLTDMFGGTPTNISLSLMSSMKLEVVTGVNLPMLLKVISSRSESLETVSAFAKQAGCSGIVVAGEVLRSKIHKGK